MLESGKSPLGGAVRAKDPTAHRRGGRLRSRAWSARTLAVAVVLGSAVWVAPVAQAATTVSQSEPIAMATENPCTGEPVTLTGTAHYTIQYSETVGTNGIKFHSVKTTKLSLSGTAMLSGARYQNEQQKMEEENGTFALDPFSGRPAPFESTTTMTMLLIRQGDTPRLDDFFMRIIGHVTYTANGVPTVGRTTFDVFCR